jgi:hypothetical protein
VAHHELSFAYNAAFIALASTNSVTFSTSTPVITSYPVAVQDDTFRYT